MCVWNVITIFNGEEVLSYLKTEDHHYLAMIFNINLKSNVMESLLVEFSS
jgi:hypothetical protein